MFHRFDGKVVNLFKKFGPGIRGGESFFTLLELLRKTV